MRIEIICPVMVLGVLAAVVCAAPLPTVPTTDVTMAPANDSVAAQAGCKNPCWVVKDYYPFKTCESQCSDDACERGWGAYVSEEVCCSPGVAFPEGCTKRPDQCWVVESYAGKTCVQDQRKCLQGYNVWESKEACCKKGAAFPEGCANVTESKEPCWVVDTYSPARLCKSSHTLCSVAAVQNWKTKEECCKPGSAFEAGCSKPPPLPCYLVSSYYPDRSCKGSDDIATCNRGWGVYASHDICCSPGVAFQEGCSPPTVEKAGN